MNGKLLKFVGVCLACLGIVAALAWLIEYLKN